MATRQSIEDCINRVESAILNAEEQYTLGSRQEHYHDVEFSDAQGQLEAAAQELEKLADSSNAQQREQLYRVGLKVQQLQNKMILLDHDHPLYSTWH
ncbi:YtzC family protein [Lederbergia citrea]|uniref:YtzC family protein n=1 Tax=Lederbergia citrea TaxID=2833581 RepID=A0A942Z5E3_9BACI|nr:YtzC family protein [Lederbergia citrea]MBS4175946.1 YtzC family protein [Lederbergia citrea]MBS4202506.1 YtzC family protein [Lederbergia citrea]MBS4222826.1 YtzC family protein [Lederbergia citrea]